MICPPPARAVPFSAAAGAANPDAEERMPEPSATWFDEMLATHADTLRGSRYADYFADPYRFFAWARAEAPVLHIPEIDAWAVSRFDDIRAIFRDPETFCSANVREPPVPLCPRAMDIYRAAGVRLEPALIDEDGDAHRRSRRLFGKGLAARRVQRYEPKIRAIVSRLIDGIADEGHGDLIVRLLQPVASRMAFHLLGGDDEDFDLADWPGGIRRVEILGAPTEAAQISLVEMVTRIWTFGGRLAETAIEKPGDNYLGDIVRTRREDPSLFTDNYLHNIVAVFQIAGSDTQSHSLAHGIRAMLVDGRAWARLCAEPGLIPNAVEEILRFCTPTLMFPRLATRDVEVAGRQIPAGARVLLLLASGNRDETVFPDAGTMDIDRQNARDHLTFGHGAHFCLGAPLARLQMKIILEELTSRLPDMQLADSGPPEVFRTFSFRGLKHLTVARG